MSEQLVNQITVCRTLGINHRQLGNWVRDGAPVHPTPNGDRYIIAELFAWHDTYRNGDPSQMTKAEAQRRREVAVALSSELDLAEKQGTLVKPTDLLKEFERALVSVRAMIVSQANRLTGKLANQPENRVAELLEADAIEILESLSHYQHEPGDYE